MARLDKLPIRDETAKNLVREAIDDIVSAMDKLESAASRLSEMDDMFESDRIKEIESYADDDLYCLARSIEMLILEDCT